MEEPRLRPWRRHSRRVRRRAQRGRMDGQRLRLRRRQLLRDGLRGDARPPDHRAVRRRVQRGNPAAQMAELLRPVRAQRRPVQQLHLYIASRKRLRQPGGPSALQHCISQQPVLRCAAVGRPFRLREHRQYAFKRFRRGGICLDFRHVQGRHRLAQVCARLRPQQRRQPQWRRQRPHRQQRRQHRSPRTCP